MAQNWIIVLSTAIVSSALGFLFAVIGLIISQRYQRWLESRTLASAILTEALNILDTLQLYQEILDKAEQGTPLPEIGISRDDMSVFLSNTAKLGLLIPTSAMHIIQFYSRVRRVAAGMPTRDLIGVIPKSSLSKLDAFRKEVSDAVLAGHAVVNGLEQQVPKERLSAVSGASLDIWSFREREKKRHNW